MTLFDETLFTFCQWRELEAVEAEGLGFENLGGQSFFFLITKIRIMIRLP